MITIMMMVIMLGVAVTIEIYVDSDGGDTGGNNQ